MLCRYDPHLTCRIGLHLTWTDTRFISYHLDDTELGFIAVILTVVLNKRFAAGKSSKSHLRTVREGLSSAPDLEYHVYSSSYYSRITSFLGHTLD